MRQLSQTVFSASEIASVLSFFLFLDIDPPRPRLAWSHNNSKIISAVFRLQANQICSSNQIFNAFICPRRCLQVIGSDQWSVFCSDITRQPNWTVRSGKDTGINHNTHFPTRKHEKQSCYCGAHDAFQPDGAQTVDHCVVVHTALLVAAWILFLDWPLVIASHFPAVYADKHVRLWDERARCFFLKERIFGEFTRRPK